MPPRRVVLVDFPWSRDKDPRVPLGHASLLTVLRTRTPAEVLSIICPANASGMTAETAVQQILKAVRDASDTTTDIAIGAYVWAEDLIQAVLPALRRGGFSGRIILGGPQVSYAAANQLEGFYPDADIFVRGYGEEALCQLASGVGLRMPGVHVARTLDSATTAAVDLVSLDSPWLTRTLDAAKLRFVRWETQRGCPFRCSFCQHREAGVRLRRRDLAEDRIMAEIEAFCSSCVEEIAVLDPIFNAGPRSTAILAALAERRFSGRLSLQCRAEHIDDSFVKAASRLNVCLEFGLQTIHDDEGRAVDRRNHVGHVNRALEMVRHSNIAHEVSLIFGLPKQTLSSFLESVEWCLARKVPVIRAFPLMLLRGTPLDRDRSKWGLVDDGTTMPMVIESTTFDRRDWYAMAQIAEALRLTERQHPRNVRALLDIATELRPTLGRWQPSATAAAKP